MGRPFPDSIKGAAFDQNVLEQHQDRLAIAGLAHGLGEMSQEPDAFDDLIKDGNCAQALA